MRTLIFIFFTICFLNTKAQETFQVTPNSVGGISLGDTISDVLKRFPESSINKVPSWEFFVGGEEKGHLIVENGIDSLMFIWSKDYGKTVGGIICLSKKYKTVDGIGIGTTLGYIESQHPNINLTQDYNYEFVENMIVKYKTGFINAQIINKPKKLTGIYDSITEDESSTRNYNRSTKINRILIWK